MTVDANLIVGLQFGFSGGFLVGAFATVAICWAVIR
jgi:hypothetical protein